MAEREPGQPESVDGSVGSERAAGATSFLQRAVVRRRVRFLRRRRELALHDLGGFLFESHRMGTPREDLLAEKLAAVSALDDELALLQRSLDLHEELAVLHEPGISACAHCATIHDSAANFCPNCGLAAGSAAADREEPALDQDTADSELTHAGAVETEQQIGPHLEEDAGGGLEGPAASEPEPEPDPDPPADEQTAEFERVPPIEAAAAEPAAPAEVAPDEVGARDELENPETAAAIAGQGSAPTFEPSPEAADAPS